MSSRRPALCAAKCLPFLTACKSAFTIILIRSSKITLGCQTGFSPAFAASSQGSQFPLAEEFKITL